MNGLDRSIRSMVRWDVRLQARYGFYTVYAVLTVLFVGGIRMVDPSLRTPAAVVLIVVDPTVLGFYFVASMVLFEKRDGVLDALVLTPLSDRGYLASKLITLSGLAVVAGMTVAVLGHGSPSNPVVLLVGLALAASFFVLVGFVAVARFQSINQYFISAVGWGSVLFLPLFGYVGVVDTPLFYLLPAQPVLVLVGGGFQSVATWELAYGIGYLVAGNVVAWVWARRSFRRHVVRGGDPGRELGASGRGHRGKVANRQSSREQSSRGQSSSGQSSRGKSSGAEPTVRSPLVGLVRADLRNWVRDPMLAIAAVGPLALAVVIRFGSPVVAELAAPVIALEPYYPVVAGSMVVFAPAIYGFVVGMFVLEDREQRVLAAYRVSPLSARGYVLYRTGTAYCLSLVSVVPALWVIGLVHAPAPVVLGTAAVGALTGAMLTLAFGTLASNTIEGVALSKLVNFVVLGPALAIAVLPEPLQFGAGVAPTYWPVKAFVAGVAGDSGWLLYLVGGAITQSVVIYVLVRRFEQRAD